MELSGSAAQRRTPSASPHPAAVALSCSWPMMIRELQGGQAAVSDGSCPVTRDALRFARQGAPELNPGLADDDTGRRACVP